MPAHRVPDMPDRLQELDDAVRLVYGAFASRPRRARIESEKKKAPPAATAEGAPRTDTTVVQASTRRIC